MNSEPTSLDRARVRALCAASVILVGLGSFSFAATAGLDPIAPGDLGYVDPQVVAVAVHERGDTIAREPVAASRAALMASPGADGVCDLLEVRVCDDHGIALAGAVVTALRGTSEADHVADGEGRCWVPADDLRLLRCDAPRYATCEVRPPVPLGGAVTVRLPPAAELRLTLRDLDGHPVCHQALELLLDDGHPDPDLARHHELHTDALGRCASTRLGNGRYRVRCQGGGRWTSAQSRCVELVAGTRVDVEIEVAAIPVAERLVVAVRDPRRTICWTNLCAANYAIEIEDSPWLLRIPRHGDAETRGPTGQWRRVRLLSLASRSGEPEPVTDWCLGCIGQARPLELEVP